MRINIRCDVTFIEMSFSYPPTALDVVELTVTLLEVRMCVLRGMWSGM